MKRNPGTGLFAIVVIGVLASNCSSDKSLEAGQRIFEQNCMACHQQGVNGAPMIGNKKLWANRVLQGEATLI
ncbi:MAG: c-type cytochrome [Methylococcales bacterium]